MNENRSLSIHIPIIVLWIIWPLESQQEVNSKKCPLQNPQHQRDILEYFILFKQQIKSQRCSADFPIRQKSVILCKVVKMTERTIRL